MEAALRRHPEGRRRAARAHREGAEVQKLSKGVYGRAGTTGTEKIFVVLAEFGDTATRPTRDGRRGDCTTAPVRRPDAQRDPEAGPLGRQLHAVGAGLRPAATSTTCTSTGCASSTSASPPGKYSIDGDVTEWVTVPFNEARYGRDFCGDIVCNNTWFLIRDALRLLGRRQARRRLDDGPRSTATWRPSTSWTVTTSTVTATSRSPTATSTTSRSCTRAATRPTATRSTVRTPSGPTAGTRRSSLRHRRSRGRRADRRHQHRRGRRVRRRRRERPCPGQPAPALGGRLHHPARERRPERLRPRVRARPRPARPLRHLRQHRWRREQRRLRGP